jgi:hypothetical protein
VVERALANSATLSAAALSVPRAMKAPNQTARLYGADAWVRGRSGRWGGRGRMRRQASGPEVLLHLPVTKRFTGRRVDPHLYPADVLLPQDRAPIRSRQINGYLAQATALLRLGALASYAASCSRLGITRKRA